MKLAKNYYNCSNVPLLCGDDDKQILDICPPPALHIFLGLMNKIYEAVAEKHPEVAEAWTSAAHVAKHTKYGFAGRHCRQLLSKRAAIRDHSNTYFELLEKFNTTINGCFKKDLSANFQYEINDFCKHWIEAGLPATPKLHILKYHVAEFCNVKQQGLARYTEQSIEAVHHDFTGTWDRYKVSNNHPRFTDNLLRAVVAYNSSHID